MYHLRRSHFLQTFNASPDETAYYRTLLQRECVIRAIQLKNVFKRVVTNNCFLSNYSWYLDGIAGNPRILPNVSAFSRDLPKNQEHLRDIIRIGKLVA